jgi:divalent metal cation (Fe/Co/Zn/Cd) transporter
MRYLNETKDSDLIVVFGENSAAVLGLGFAIVALLLAWKTNDGRFDGFGSIAIGLVLVGVAIFLARKVMSLLLGESADPEIERIARELADGMPQFERVLSLVTVQQGPSEVLLSIKIAFGESPTIEDVCRAINDFESKMRAARPEVRWIYVEPDTPYSRRDPVLAKGE